MGEELGEELANFSGLLAINLPLSALSTSAPAPSLRVDPTVSRRGTCDRRIWTKSLAFAADAGSLSFSMGFQWPFRHLIASRESQEPDG